MDQTFNFRAATVPMARRVSRRAIALALMIGVVVSGLVVFSTWVVDSERRSMEREAPPEDTTPMVGTISGAGAALTGSIPVSGRLAVDSTVRADVRAALASARRAASGSDSFLDAGPGQLAATGSPMIFVDGPSRAPAVVSVASTRDTWGAAVMGSSGTCYLLRYAPGDGVTYGAGGVCTGAEALTVTDPSW